MKNAMWPLAEQEWRRDQRYLGFKKSSPFIRHSHKINLVHNCFCVVTRAARLQREKLPIVGVRALRFFVFYGFRSPKLDLGILAQ